MEKGMIPKRAITIGYNGPTKRNVTPEEILKDIKQDLWQRILDKENRLMRTFQSHAKDSLRIKKWH